MEKSYFNIPTAITCFRLAMVPMFLYTANIDMRIAVALFIVASMSDWLDGYLARKLSCQSDLGALLDPIADKLMSWAALWVINNALQNHLLMLASLCIVARDILLSVQRIYFYMMRRMPEALTVSKMAKIKTAMLFFSQALLTFYLYAQIELVYAMGIVLLYASCLLTLISLGSYIRAQKH